MTLPVYNLNSRFVDAGGFLLQPWNSFFQQLVQPAPAVVNGITSPFTANSKGTLILTGAGVITLTRGSDVITLTGERIIPISINDTVTFAGGSGQFLGA